MKEGSLDDGDGGSETCSGGAWRWGWVCAISLVLGCDEQVLGCDEPVLGCAISFGCFSLSSIFLGCNSFEGRIRPKMILHERGLIVQSTQKINFNWPNFQYIPNTERGVKGFPEIIFSRNKRSLSVIRLKQSV